MEQHQPMPRRINPRRPYVIAASGLKRIILGAEEGLRGLLLARHVAPQKAVRSTLEARHYLLVLAHADRGALDEHARQAIAAAALLAEPDTGVVVAVLGGSSEDLGASGADIVVNLPQCDAVHFCPELALGQVQALVERYQPRHIFIADRDADADLGRRLAARSGRTIATDVVELDADGACRVIPGAKYARCALPHIVLLARNAVDANLPFVGRGQSDETPLRAAPGVAAVRDLGLEASSPDRIGLEEADFILSGGNGMRDMDTFTALASALGAATGASRVAVDDGRFVRAKQIGATGKTVQASVYLALGISGAVQHLQGIKDCRHVIAVNLDESAPIAKRANLTIVEDAQALMRALLRQVRMARGMAPA
ncbi:MAG: electron transfer flavoprotein subunit alpha/FixB family protein [Pseudomonadota bacterium]